MLNPDYIRDMCRKLRLTAQEMEDDIIAAIIALLLAMSETDVVNITEASRIMSEITEHYRVLGIREIRHIIRDSVMENVQTEQQAYTQAEQAIEQQAAQQPAGGAEQPGEQPGSPANDLYGGQRIGTEVPKYPMHDPYIRNVVEHVDRQTEGTWNNITQTQAYSGVQRYVELVDRAVLETAIGEKSWNKARQDAIDELVQNGVPTVTSGTSGRTESAATAAERNTRTAVSRLSGDITLEMAKKNGITLVLVSAHYGARPSHRPWQGKVFSIVGKTEKYDDFYTATEYGTMLGLCGINCRHSFSAFVEGMNNPYEGKDYNDPQRYNDEQKQRALERNIRYLRRKKKALQEENKSQKTDETRQKLQAVNKKLKDAVAEYEKFCEDHDFRPLWERTKG